MHGDGYETRQVQRVRFFFWENSKTDLCSPIKGILQRQKNAKFEKGLFSMTMQTNKPRVACNLKKKKVVFNWFVLEKFFNENATRKKNTLAIDERSGEKHAF